MQARNLRSSMRSRQRGATLIVGLVLLLVLTVLGVSGMNTATMELTMAGNAQFQQDAFQMAEDGIDIAIVSGFSTLDPLTVPWLGGTPDRNRQSRTTFVTTTDVPGAAYSLGVRAPQAFHFDVVSVGRASRSATSVHNQSFYVVGPGS
jgi:hypothetical protein